MLLQIALLNTSIITVRAFVRFFSSMNSSVVPQFIEFSEFLFTELACKWFITGVHLHMNIQSCYRFERFGTNSTHEGSFSHMNFLLLVFNRPKYYDLDREFTILYGPYRLWSIQIMFHVEVLHIMLNTIRSKN